MHIVHTLQIPQMGPPARGTRGWRRCVYIHQGAPGGRWLFKKNCAGVQRQLLIDMNGLSFRV